MVPFLSSKFVLGSTLPSGLIMILSGSSALTGKATIERETSRPIRIKPVEAKFLSTLFRSQRNPLSAIINYGIIMFGAAEFSFLFIYSVFFLALNRAVTGFSAEFLGIFALVFGWLTADFAFHFQSLAAKIEGENGYLRNPIKQYSANRKDLSASYFLGGIQTGLPSTVSRSEGNG